MVVQPYAVLGNAPANPRYLPHLKEVAPIGPKYR
tara:strand:+ start:70 stop:171 length:102 start_codon:yes stop_codon:yes gene_type:complete